MGFFSDLDPTNSSGAVGGFVNRAFSNPAKLVADISTFGTTAVLRALPKSIGGGQAGAFAKGSEVFGGTAIGVVTGFATGGPAGAAVGGASGFGRGVSGVINNESGSAIAGGSAKYAAITGSVAGTVKGIALARAGESATYFTGPNASGIVGKGANTIYADLFSKTLGTSAATSTSVAAKSGFSFGSTLESLAPLALLNTLQGQKILPGTSGGSTGVTLNSPGPGPTTAAPSNGPNLYPGIPPGLQTVAPGPAQGAGAAVAIAPKSTNWLLWAAVALIAFFFLQKKKHGF